MFLPFIDPTILHLNDERQISGIILAYLGSVLLALVHGPANPDDMFGIVPASCGKKLELQQPTGTPTPLGSRSPRIRKICSRSYGRVRKSRTVSTSPSAAGGNVKRAAWKEFILAWTQTPKWSNMYIRPRIRAILCYSSFTCIEAWMEMIDFTQKYLGHESIWKWTKLRYCDRVSLSRWDQLLL